MLAGACEHSAVCKTLLSSTQSHMKQYMYDHFVLDCGFFIFYSAELLYKLCSVPIFIP